MAKINILEIQTFFVIFIFSLNHVVYTLQFEFNTNKEYNA